jgi:hypothetical protein
MPIRACCTAEDKRALGGLVSPPLPVIGTRGRRWGSPPRAAEQAARLTVIRPATGCRAASQLANETLSTRGEPHRPASGEPSPTGASHIVPTGRVPPTCHKQRSPAVPSGHSRSHEEADGLGAPPLTWGGGGAETAWPARGRSDRSERECGCWQGRHRTAHANQGLLQPSWHRSPSAIASGSPTRRDRTVEHAAAQLLRKAAAAMVQAADQLAGPT